MPFRNMISIESNKLEYDLDLKPTVSDSSLIAILATKQC